MRCETKALSIAKACNVLEFPALNEASMRGWFGGNAPCNVLDNSSRALPQPVRPKTRPPGDSPGRSDFN